ncbi:MAG: hypothetical protein AAFX03_14480 [Pseudomonadota bacterium]
MATADGSDERALKRGFWRHLLAGYAVGVAIAAIGVAIILFSLRGQDMNISWIYILAAFVNLGTIGGFVGVMVFVTRETDRSA